MKITHFVLAISFLLCSLRSGQAQSLQVTKVDGGSVVTVNSSGHGLNADSSLRRSWFVINDPSCSVQLTNAGIATGLDYNQYYFSEKGAAKVSNSILAYEIRYMLFDVFGNHLRTLSIMNVKDVSNGTTCGQHGLWKPIRSNYAAELLTVVTVVTQVREADGKIWRFNPKSLGEEIARVGLKVPGEFEPSPSNKEGQDDK